MLRIFSGSEGPLVAAATVILCSPAAQPVSPMMLDLLSRKPQRSPLPWRDAWLRHSDSSPARIPQMGTSRNTRNKHCC